MAHRCKSHSACMAQRSGSQGACIAHRCERQSACMVFRCASRSACMAHACPDKYGIRTKGTQSKQKKRQNKQKQKFSHDILGPACSLVDCLQWGLNPGGCNCRGTALPTRVWPFCDVPLHRGGIDIWSNLVFIHHWVLLKKPSILSIDTWGENPFFHSTKSSKYALGRLWRPWSGTSGPISREGEGGGGGESA